MSCSMSEAIICQLISQSVCCQSLDPIGQSAHPAELQHQGDKASVSCSMSEAIICQLISQSVCCQSLDPIGQSAHPAELHCYCRYQVGSHVGSLSRVLTCILFCLSLSRESFSRKLLFAHSTKWELQYEWVLLGFESGVCAYRQLSQWCIQGVAAIAATQILDEKKVFISSGNMWKYGL